MKSEMQSEPCITAPKRPDAYIHTKLSRNPAAAYKHLTIKKTRQKLYQQPFRIHNATAQHHNRRKAMPGGTSVGEGPVVLG